jgi:hypothetical protein
MSTIYEKTRNWADIFSISFPEAIDTSKFYYWDAKGNLDDHPSPISINYQVDDNLDSLISARFQPLILVPRQIGQGAVELLFKKHSLWGDVIPTTEIINPPTTYNELEKEIVRNIPKIIKQHDYSGLKYCGGLFSCKRSPTNNEPNLYFFPFFIARASIGDRSSLQYEFQDQQYHYLTKNLLETKYHNPNGDVYRALEKIFPSWNFFYKYCFHYDYAISFAGEKRELVEMLVNKISEKDKNITIFYDQLEDLQGLRLYDAFYSVFYEKSRYVLVFMSKEYMKKEWTIHEFQAAKDRLIEERGTNYILPFKTDSIIIPELK